MLPRFGTVSIKENGEDRKTGTCLEIPSREVTRGNRDGIRIRIDNNRNSNSNNIVQETEAVNTTATEKGIIMVEMTSSIILGIEKTIDVMMIDTDITESSVKKIKVVIVTVLPTVIIADMEEMSVREKADMKKVLDTTILLVGAIHIDEEMIDTANVLDLLAAEMIEENTTVKAMKLCPEVLMVKSEEEVVEGVGVEVKKEGRKNTRNIKGKEIERMTTEITSVRSIETTGIPRSIGIPMNTIVAALVQDLNK